jgi:hypothetical protein
MRNENQMETLDDQGLEAYEVLADGRSFVRSDHERRRGGTYPLPHLYGHPAHREKAGASARLARARLTETASAFLQVAGCSERPAIGTDGGLFRVSASLTLYVAGCFGFLTLIQCLDGLAR